MLGHGQDGRDTLPAAAGDRRNTRCVKPPHLGQPRLPLLIQEGSFFRGCAVPARVVVSKQHGLPSLSKEGWRLCAGVVSGSIMRKVGTWERRPTRETPQDGANDLEHAMNRRRFLLNTGKLSAALTITNAPFLAALDHPGNAKPGAVNGLMILAST